jgi:hypothetical protein
MLPTSMRAWPLPVLLLAGACAHPEGTSLSQCMAERTAAAGIRAPSLAVAEQWRGLCYDLLADQERVRRLSATARIYEDQLFQNHVMLYMVVFITLSGVILAGLQLWASYRLAVSGKGQLAEGGDLSIHPGNVAVKSSVVGVVILAISLAFFMIFVTDVYRITPASETAASPASAPSPPPPGMTEVPR